MPRANRSRAQQLEADFCRIGTEWAEAFRANDPKRANDLYEELYHITRRMRRLPDKGKAGLKRMIQTAPLKVKVFIAAALLALDESFAMQVLEDISSQKLGLISFTAEMTIKEWRNGNIREYWS